MTPDETIEQQARREAEAKYFVKDYFYPARYAKVELQREAYAAALIAERSKPRPSVDEVMDCMDNYFGDARFDIPWDILHRGEGKDILRERLTKVFNK